jgi:hypothetical protein
MKNTSLVIFKPQTLHQRLLQLDCEVCTKAE